MNCVRTSQVPLYTWNAQLSAAVLQPLLLRENINWAGRHYKAFIYLNQEAITPPITLYLPERLSVIEQDLP